jgi:hypothetical protein
MSLNVSLFFQSLISCVLFSPQQCFGSSNRLIHSLEQIRLQMYITMDQTFNVNFELQMNNFSRDNSYINPTLLISS